MPRRVAFWGMLQGQVFSLVAVVAVAAWLAIDLTRHPERRPLSVANALFAVYLIAVIQTTMFPIPTSFGAVRPPPATRINLIPLKGLFGIGDISRVQAVPNILLGVPFGFLAFFVLRTVSWKRILGLGVLFFVVVEVVQVVIAYTFPAAPRTGDINDVMLNTIGVALGIAAFFACARLFVDRDDGEALGSSEAVEFIRGVARRAA